MLVSLQTSAEKSMDESALLDLLECPVCLERLDASAKVLPCQHTFCKRCLQGIVSSRSELRCPECRTLVECGVEELPSNILLVRLLDGIKQRPRKPGPSTGNSTNALRAQGSVTTNCGTNDAQSTQGGPQRIQARSPPVRVSTLHDVYRHSMEPIHTGAADYITHYIVVLCFPLHLFSAVSAYVELCRHYSLIVAVGECFVFIFSQFKWGKMWNLLFPLVLVWCRIPDTCPFGMLLQDLVETTHLWHC